MKIARIRWAPFRIPFVRPYETARGGALTATASSSCSKPSPGIEARRGVPRPVGARDEAQSILPHIESMARGLIAADVADIDDVLEPHSDGDEADRAAHCAIETALADAGAREAGQPLAELLERCRTASRRARERHDRRALDNRGRGSRAAGVGAGLRLHQAQGGHGERRWPPKPSASGQYARLSART